LALGFNWLSQLAQNIDSPNLSQFSTCPIVGKSSANKKADYITGALIGKPGTEVRVTLQHGNETKEITAVRHAN
jgi:C-terminal processing protease CtpA/Prc